MTIDEIFQGAAIHMTKGITIHNQIASAFGFLNLQGYQKEQEHRFIEESVSYRKLQNFYLNLCGKIINISPPDDPQIISPTWYKYTKFAVDISTKKNGIRDLVKKWYEWEKETLKLWETYYKELYEQKEIFAATYIQRLIEEVGAELLRAETLYINLDSINYDMSQIIAEQPQLCQRYEGDIDDQISTTKINYSSW